LVEGCIGHGAAVAFAKFLSSLRLPDPDEVLDGKAQATVSKLRDDELYVLFSAMAAALVRRQQQDGFVDAMLIFLDLAEQVCRDGKVDTIFVTMRQVAQGQLLSHAVAEAQRNGRLKEMQEALKRTFERTPLQEFVATLA
jgi:hypothetical protein